MRTTGVPLGLSWAPAAVGNWVPGMRPQDPYPVFNFAVEIEGLLVGGFTEVNGLESSIETESYHEGGVNSYVHQLPVTASASNLILRHGFTSANALWSWHSQTVDGIIRRKNGTIMLLNRQQIPVMWWNFRNALPVRWTGPTFDARSDDVGFESIELAHEGLTRPLLGQALTLAHTVAGFAGVTVDPAGGRVTRR